MTPLRTPLLQRSSPSITTGLGARRSASALLALFVFGCSISAEEGEELSGGDTTVFDTSRNAFSYSARNLDFDRRSIFLLGNSFFNDVWVTAPASTQSRDGLGPLFNARSCSGCHNRDGRGQPPSADQEMVSMLLRVSIPGEDEHGGPNGVPGYGGQLQPRAIDGVPPEVVSRVTWEEIEGQYDDGEVYSLRRPIIALSDPAFGALPDDLMISARIGPPTFGLGLLEAIPEDVILGNADPDDVDGDGVSGRANYVYDVVSDSLRLGRFGWKANQPNLAQQNQGAFLGDVGITSPLFPSQNCDAGQDACAASIAGGEPELSQDLADSVNFYVMTVAVPARRDVDDPTVLEGRELFMRAGCESCHIRRFETGVLDAFPELSEQTIRPFTDLLLHDMGEGLADGRPDYAADGQEWRTPPLWGVGLTDEVSGHTFFLHDGRARGFAEAILWHGGEAEAARDAFVAMSRGERDALLRFLESL